MPPEVAVRVTKPRSAVARKLAALGVTVQPVRDDLGNVDRFFISKRLVIERRSAGAFLNGIMDKTLFSEALFLRERFRVPVLIIEGRIPYDYSAFDPQAVRGALSSMMIEYALSVLRTDDADETAALIALMARHEQHGIPEISLIPKRTAKSLADMQRRVAEMLPGCGRVMARDLLQHFGSVQRIADANTNELREVRGIGAKKAAQIRRVLTATYESMDTERQLEDAVEHSPELVFPQPVRLLARQHHIYDDDDGKHIVDMVFHDERADEIVLVELKRDRLRPAHREQLARYLRQAHRSSLIGRYLRDESSLRGVLATVEPGAIALRDRAMTAVIVDRVAVVRVLVALREARLA